jgi:hypothetical protein
MLRHLRDAGSFRESILSAAEQFWCVGHDLTFGICEWPRVLRLGIEICEWPLIPPVGIPSQLPTTWGIFLDDVIIQP